MLLDETIERYGWTPPAPEDREALKEQIGREPHPILAVARRCHYGKPLVVVNDPLPPGESGGTPGLFPTLFWLTCPYLVQRTGSLEGEGWIEGFRRRQHSDPAWAGQMAAAHRRQGELRLALADPGRLERLKEEAPARYDVLASSGVGGMRAGAGVKCLHAHLADYLARTRPGVPLDSAEPVNPVGRETARLLLNRGVDLMGSPACAACRSASLEGSVLASVDIGSNSVRLWVGQMSRPLRELDRGLETTRLGAAAREGRLDEEAMEATVNALKGFALRIRAAGAAAVSGAATAAVREAENGGELLVRVWEGAGLSVPAIPGELEAELSYSGVLRSLPGEPGKEGALLVIDVGGGSTELVLGTLSGRILDRESLPLGAVRLTGRFLEDEAARPEALEALLDHVRREAGAVAGRFPAGDALVAAVGGTATSVAALAQQLEEYDPERVHGYTMERGELERLLDRLSRMPLAERRKLRGLSPRRAEIIVAGVAILNVLLEVLGADRFTVSEADLLQGLAWRLAGAHERMGRAGE